MQVSSSIKFYLKEGERFTFLPKNAHPNANAILPFQTKSEISMHPKQSSKQIRKRSRKQITYIKMFPIFSCLKKMHTKLNGKMISLTFPNKSNSNARKAENIYFFLMKVRSRISNNHAQNKKKIVQQTCK